MIPRWAAALWCALMLTPPASATMPPLPLPAWVKVELALDRAPEVNGVAQARLTLTALLDRLEGVRWELDVPGEVDVVSGQKHGTADLEKGKALSVQVGVRAHAPVEGANLAVLLAERGPLRLVDLRVVQPRYLREQQRCPFPHLAGGWHQPNMRRRS